MSGSTNLKPETSTINIAKQSGLLDALKSKNQSMSISSTSRNRGNISCASSNYMPCLRTINDTDVSEAAFKVPQVPVSSRPISKRGIEWDCKNGSNSLALQLCCNNFKKQLNTANSMYYNNESALLGLYTDLFDRISEFLQSEHEKTINLNSTTINGINMELSTISSYSTYNDRSHYNNRINSNLDKNVDNSRPQVLQCIDNHQQYAERDLRGNYNFVEPERPFSRSSSVASLVEPNQANERQNNTRNFQGNSNYFEHERQFSKPSSEFESVQASKRQNNTNTRNPVKEYPFLLESYIKKAYGNNKHQISSIQAEVHKENEDVSSPTLRPKNNPFVMGIFGDSDFETSPVLNKTAIRKNKRLSTDSLDFSPNETVMNKSIRKNSSTLHIRGVKKARPSLSVASAKSINSLEKRTLELKNWTIRRKENSKNFEVIGHPVLQNGKLGNLKSTGIITARLNKTTLRAQNGNVVLIGPMKYNSEVHPIIKAKFIHGFPTYWRKILNTPAAM